MWTQRALVSLSSVLLVACQFRRESTAPAGVSSGARVPIARAMVGSWCGQARINNSWIGHRTLDVSINISSNAVVHGTVGDAVLVAATFKPNRNALKRALNVKTDWIIVGTLEGDMIAAEGIRRNGVKSPLNWIVSDSGGSFRGGVNTSGLPIGSEGSSGIAASRLVLIQCPPSTYRAE
jgi:hypothetical protein